MSEVQVTESELQAYADGRLDVERSAAVEAWLAARPDQAERVEHYRKITEELRAAYDPVLEEPVPESLIQPLGERPHWPRYAAAAAWVALGIAVGGVAGWQLHEARPTAAPVADVGAVMARRAAIAHATYSPEIRHPVEVGADQEAHLVAWLSKRLGAPLRAPKLEAVGYNLIGGRLLPGDNGPVAHFMYQCNQGTRVTLYVRTDVAGNRETAFRYAKEGNVRVFYWVDRKIGYALSSADISTFADLRDLAAGIRAAGQGSQEEIEAQRGRVALLKGRLEAAATPEARWLLSLADYLVAKSVWGVGGDGWAYDIGYGGLDQVLASGENVNLLVLDTEVYSNTGGQMSKATPLAATAQFAAGGKRTPKKDLALIMATYGTIYVAQVAFAANLQQTVRAFAEAEAYPGPSLVIGYAHCISHGFDMSRGLDQMQRAVACGHWPLFRFNPALEREGKSPLVIDSKAPTIGLADYVGRENRYRSLRAKDPALFEKLMAQAEADLRRRWDYLQHLASWKPGRREPPQPA